MTDYIAQVPFLQLAGQFKDARAATEWLRENEVQLLFLDIHLEVTIACGVILSYYLTKWVESLRIEERWTARTKGGSGR